MILFLKLALRNVFRNRARTAVALLAIAAGCAALIVNGGVIYNIFAELREDAIRGRYGHIQIYAAGYSDGHLTQPGFFLIEPEDARRAVELLRELPGVERVTRRREFSGMIASGVHYVAFMGIGVEPESDSGFSRAELRAGEELSAEDRYGMSCGLGLAQKFDGSPGTLVSLMANTDSGALNISDVTLRGIFEGGMKAYDDWVLKLPLPAVEELLLDDRTEKILVLLDDHRAVEEQRERMAELFEREGLELETRAWNELALFHNQVVDLFSRELDVIKVIVATIVILGIANTIGMSILERRIELATLRALGLRRVQVGSLLLVEALLTGLIGGVLGLVLGWGIAEIVTAIGIPFPSPPGSTRAFHGGVDFVPGVAAFAFVLSVLATLAAALLPVWKATKRPIAETLRGR
ncbi:MAG: ABC transporter permease [bacterium]|nr:ABC transporter permease [bacterium]